MSKTWYDSFEKIWQYQQGALFLKAENTSLEWRKSLADFFYRHGYHAAQTNKIVENLKSLDGVAAVNLAEPSEGDLERINNAYRESLARERVLDKALDKIDDHIRIMRVEGLIDMKEMCRALKVLSDNLPDLRKTK